MTKKRILIISHDKIGTNMAGPGIRYHYMATTLSKDFYVTVGFFDPTYLPDDNFKHTYAVKHVDKGEFHDSFSANDIIIALWLGEDMLDYCEKLGLFVVFDIYAPVPVENLALFTLGSQKITAHTDFVYEQSLIDYERFLERGDLFLFSNRRQLDYWIGYTFGSKLILVSSYMKRNVFERFIYAPMGIDTKTKLTHTKPVIRDVMKGISQKDKVLIWTGGIWNWYDAKTLMKAMARLKKTRPDIKLVFFGTKHPNPDVPAMKEATEAFALARELGLFEKTVFMHEGWVPYPERINYLLESDAAVNTNKDTIESEFSHRTRVLDHILTGLPTVSTAGDYISDEVIARKDLGIVVQPYDVDSLYRAIIDAVDDKNNKRIKQQIEAIRAEYDWEQTLAPLRDSLLNNPTKLERVKVPRTRQMPKNTKAYKIAKALLPRRAKHIIVKTLRYGK
jgi:glycosyltransferase involved in cell wall biosynthesis